MEKRERERERGRKGEGEKEGDVEGKSPSVIHGMAINTVYCFLCQPCERYKNNIGCSVHTERARRSGGER